MTTFRFELGNEEIELVARNFNSAWKKAYKFFKQGGFICTYNPAWR